MKVHGEELSDVTRYLEKNKGETLAGKKSGFRRILSYVGKYKPISSDLRIIEIGTGTGSFPILCALAGYDCEGLEISQQLINHAHAWGKELGVEPNIRLGNVETTDLGESVYDVLIASSVFEHIEFWRPALKKMYRALKPGGALFFESTNKWSIKSGELPQMPCYGWLPNQARFALRKIIHGRDIMKLGIDFHQFTYLGLRNAFRQVGFSEIHDVSDLVDTTNKSGWKLKLIQQMRSNSLLRETVLLFMEATTFVCVK
jgi:2-polyprenyl-3-methyl-5-hydroxy-6-metoxy-1,4-benzoquinol methylase